MIGRAGHEDRTAEFVAGLRRRRAASWRCPPLGDTGRRDPFHDRRPRRWTRHELESWLDAYGHLAAHGHDVAWCLPVEAREQLAVAS